MPRRLPPQQRVLSGVVAAACLTVLGVAAALRADPSGHGTHTQIGLAPCQFLAATGRPCPTCGMTTAFAHAAHGSYASGWLAQPLGLVLAVGAAVAFWVGLIGASSGLRVAGAFAWVLRPAALWTAGGAAAAAWAYKAATWPA